MTEQSVQRAGISPVNLEAIRQGLPEVGAIRCDRCGGLDGLSGPRGATSLALTVEDVLGRLSPEDGAGECMECDGGRLVPAHPEVLRRWQEGGER